MLKNMQEENEGTDEGAAGGSTKKGTDAGTVSYTHLTLPTKLEV